MIIGLTAGGSKTQYYINKAYLDYVVNAGATPILITPGSDVADLTALCDGLLLPGGIDIEPTFYGENNVGSNNCDPEKDNFERKVFHSFLQSQKPVFGICRGFQMIIREFIEMHRDVKGAFNGLSYYQHINHHALAAERNIPRSTPSHSVKANFGVLYGQEGKADGEHFVNSIHHQALVARDNASLTVVINENTSMKAVATTEFGIMKDEKFIVEAVDIMWNGIKVRGVQWHPEELNDVELFQTFFEDALAGANNEIAEEV